MGTKSIPTMIDIEYFNLLKTRDQANDIATLH